MTCTISSKRSAFIQVVALNSLSQVSSRCHIRQDFPGADTEGCVDLILHNIPYIYSAAGDNDGRLTMVLVLTGEIKIPENDAFRRAVHYYLKPGEAKKKKKLLIFGVWTLDRQGHVTS